jgi:hypothetical protein
MALTTNFTDSSTMATAHAQHHDDLATWANSGMSPFPAWTAGRMVVPRPYAATTSGVQPTNAVGYSARVPTACTVSAISVQVAAAVTSSQLDLYVYGSNAAGTAPNVMLIGPVNFTCTTTGVKTTTLGAAYTFTAPTDIWIVVRTSNGFSAPNLYQMTPMIVSLVETPTSLTNAAGKSWSTITPATAMPADFTATASAANANMPLVAFTLA